MCGEMAPARGPPSISAKGTGGGSLWAALNTGASYGGGRVAKQKPRVRSGARWVRHLLPKSGLPLS